MLMMRRIYSEPSMVVSDMYSLGLLFSSETNRGCKVPFIKLDFPDPETPVIQVNKPNGILTCKPFKLFFLALFILISFSLFTFSLFNGVAIDFCPFKY